MVVGAGVVEVHVVLAVLAAFWGGRGGLGAPRRSPQLRESVLGRREAVLPGRVLRAMLDHFAARRFQLPVSRPLPLLPTLTVPVCGALGSPEVGAPSSLQGPGP